MFLFGAWELYLYASPCQYVGLCQGILPLTAIVPQTVCLFVSEEQI